MPISARLLPVLILALACAAPANASLTTVFADTFEDGSVADWTVTKSDNISVPQVIVRTDSVASGSGALWTFFDAPGGGTGAGSVQASHLFTAPVTANYTLTLWARSAVSRWPAWVRVRTR
jgi:hypothetical protein